jgi:hypothetical protein
VSRTDQEIGVKIAQTARRSIASMAIVPAQLAIVSVSARLSSASVVSFRQRVMTIALDFEYDFGAASLPIAPLP